MEPYVDQYYDDGYGVFELVPNTDVHTVYVPFFLGGGGREERNAPSLSSSISLPFGFL
jgi:hypothetical protein